MALRQPHESVPVPPIKLNWVSYECYVYLSFADLGFQFGLSLFLGLDFPFQDTEGWVHIFFSYRTAING